MVTFIEKTLKFCRHVYLLWIGFSEKHTM